MPDNKMNVFEIVLLVVGIGVAILGFQLINQVYKIENYQLSWLMIIAIFSPDFIVNSLFTDFQLLKQILVISWLCS